MDAIECKKRFDALWSMRKTTEQTWDLIEQFIAPLRGGKFFQEQSSEHEVDWRRREIFDDTAPNGADILASSLHSSLTSPAIKWFDLQFQDKVGFEPDNDAKKWLQDCSDAMYSEIQASNFNMEMPEGYLDLVSFGNSVLTQETKSEPTEPWKGFHFQCVPIREIYFEENYKGELHNFYRLLQWTPTQIVSKFGKENCPERICEAAENAASMDTREKVIFCIYKNPMFDKKTDLSKPVPPANRPYLWKYIIHRDAEEIKGDMGSGGYYEMPAFITRWRTTSGSMWGYGPGHLSIPSVLTLNELVELVLKSAEKVIDPAMMVTERGVLSDLNLSAGGVNVVRDVESSMRPFESGARFDVSALQIDDLRGMVRRIFRVDQLELKESPAMTATEVQVRYELMNRLLGPTLGRLSTELYDKMISNTFNAMMRAGRLPTPPQSVIDAKAEYKVEYVGPLARAQKMDAVASIERWLGIVAPMGDILPEILDLPNPEEIGREVADRLNVPAGLLHTKGEFGTIQKLKREKQELMEQLAMAQEASQVASNMAGAGDAGIPIPGIDTGAPPA